MFIQLFLINMLIWNVVGKLNFLFIVIDDLRTALGCYGDNNSYTPNIDTLSKESVIFSQAFAQQALCAPSRNSFLTGRRPDTLQLYDFYSYWRNVVGNFSTLPQHLKNNGYITMSIGKIFHPGISSNFSDDSPYSWTTKPFHPFTNHYKNAPVCPNVLKTSLAQNLICPVDVTHMPNKTLPDIEIVNEARKFIHIHRNNSKPFLLAVGFQKPHIPLKYPKKYLKYHPITKFKIPTPYRWSNNVSSVAYNPWIDLRIRKDVEALSLKFPWERIPENFAKSIIQSYYAAVSFIDDMVGMLIHQLKVSKIRKNTVVILTSDHGWSLGEHAEWSKYSNYDVSLHVPLIISIPGLTFKEQQYDKIKIKRKEQFFILKTQQKKLFNVNKTVTIDKKNHVTDVKYKNNRKTTQIMIEKFFQKIKRQYVNAYTKKDFRYSNVSTIDKKLFSSINISKNLNYSIHSFTTTNANSRITLINQTFVQSDVQNIIILYKRRKLIQRFKTNIIYLISKEDCAFIHSIVELVDIFPTIADLAGNSIPICSDQNKYNSDTFANTCSEGISLLPLITAALECKTIPWKKAAFSQYPRPSITPTLHPNSDKPRLKEINIMGYSVKTNQYRYTAWLPFSHKTKKANWDIIIAEELYDHKIDFRENFNVATSPHLWEIKEELKMLLKHGWRQALPDHLK